KDYLRSTWSKPEISINQLQQKSPVIDYSNMQPPQIIVPKSQPPDSTYWQELRARQEYWDKIYRDILQ
ncbi:MAG: hypothetical protein ACE5NM_05470, partial [Sedimentisphaerales bacterium]